MKEQRDHEAATVTPKVDRMTYFFGGPLDGQGFKTAGATYYMHGPMGGPYAEYKRTVAVYSDGSTYANEVNRERFSHLEYTYCRDVGPQ